MLDGFAVPISQTIQSPVLEIAGTDEDLGCSEKVWSVFRTSLVAEDGCQWWFEIGELEFSRMIELEELFQDHIAELIWKCSNARLQALELLL